MTEPLGAIGGEVGKLLLGHRQVVAETQQAAAECAEPSFHYRSCHGMASVREPDRLTR